jgi:ribosomal protein L28
MKGQSQKSDRKEFSINLFSRKEEEILRMDFANTILRVVEKEMSVAHQLRIPLEVRNHA